jgi:hypothetical protein
MVRKSIFVAAAIALTVFPALAHDVAQGPHGGPIVDVKGHHVEFTTKDSAIFFYLTGDEDAPVSSAGAEGKAIIQDSGKSSTVMLTPVEPNLMTGKIETSLGAGAKVVISGKLSDGHEILARFVVK